MPEFGICSAEHPTKSVQHESGLDMTIVSDINVIIEVDEGILMHLPENGKCDDCQNKINDQYFFLGNNIYFI